MKSAVFNFSYMKKTLKNIQLVMIQLVWSVKKILLELKINGQGTYLKMGVSQYEVIEVQYIPLVKSYVVTVPIGRIISAKNARAWVSMDFT